MLKNRLHRGYMKTKIFTFFITAALALVISMPCCFAVDNNTLVPKTKVEKKSEAKNVLSKFMHSMLLVGGSCVVIFLLLLAYRRFKNNKVVNPNIIVDIEKNLNTPETVEEATRFIIEKF